MCDKTSNALYLLCQNYYIIKVFHHVSAESLQKIGQLLLRVWEIFLIYIEIIVSEENLRFVFSAVSLCLRTLIYINTKLWDKNLPYIISYMSVDQHVDIFLNILPFFWARCVISFMFDNHWKQTTARNLSKMETSTYDLQAFFLKKRTLFKPKISHIHFVEWVHYQFQ